VPPTLRVYAMKETEVRDLDGYILCFGQDVPLGPLADDQRHLSSPCTCRAE
jgi:hypothetical protein